MHTRSYRISVMWNHLLSTDRSTTVLPPAKTKREPAEIPPAQQRPWSGNTIIRLAVLVAAAIVVVLFATQWDRWVGLQGPPVTGDGFGRGGVTALHAKLES